MSAISLSQLIADFFRRHAFPLSCGVVAVSGGPDSVCLASLLRELQALGAVPRLVLAHLNHQLRGSESDADEAFVEELAQSWGWPFRSARINVAEAAQNEGANQEAVARRLRYDWFTQVAREEGAAWVATGHSASDQAETILFRLLRGSGLQGLMGMAERRTLAPDIDLIRPLLAAPRQAILDYLAEHQQGYRQDSSNLDVRFTRNRLRHELLPLLTSHYNPAIEDVLCRLAVQAREVHEEITSLAAQLLARAELPRAGSVIVLALAELMAASPQVRRELFRALWQRENWPMGEMTFESWDRLSRLVDGSETAASLPGGVEARRVGSVVQVERKP